MKPNPIPSAPDEVGRRIRALRKAFGYKTQGEFAKAIDAQRGEVAAWESGGRRPSVEKAEPMIRKFRITLDWLFLGDSGRLDHDLALRLHDTQSALESEDQG